jgi:hypothetical protein
LRCTQAELERVRAEGRKLVDEAKDRGKMQYTELVESIERQYMAEFESSVAGIRARTEADVQACAVLETEISRARSMLADAEARRVASDTGADGRAEREGKQREELQRLQDSLRELWTTRAVPSVEIMAFLKRLQMVCCSCAIVSLALAPFSCFC